MPIKYGELTIIHNANQTDILKSLSSWLGYEQTATKESKFIFLFDDGEIYDTNDNLKDFNFKFFNSCLLKPPVYFEKTKLVENKVNYNPSYFYKKPEQKDNLKKLDFKPLFGSYANFNSSMNIPSYYNSIYYCYKSLEKSEIFGILRIKSNESMPRFQFAYDSDEFTKEEVIYLINYILKS